MKFSRVSGSILNDLNHRLEVMPRAMSRITQYEMTNPEKVARQSISARAEQSASGQASGVRMAKVHGFEGFSEFKTDLNIEHAQEPILADQPLTELDHTAIFGVPHRCRCSGNVQAYCPWNLGPRCARNTLVGLCLGIRMQVLSDQVGNRIVAVTSSASGNTPHIVAILKDAARRAACTSAICTR